MIPRSNVALAVLSALALGGVALTSSGCSDDAFCFTCTTPGTTTGGTSGGGSAGAAGTDISAGGAGPIGGAGPGTGGTAGCADTQSDPLNCGTCGHVCGRVGTTAACALGACTYECAPGNVDIDGDKDAIDQSNGCECAVTNSGIEICDGLDNDCNGQIDEGYDLTSLDNCGVCGHQCLLQNGQMECAPVANPAPGAPDHECKKIGCTPPFNDDPDVPGDDCSYVCSVNNGGTEICNGIDDDCNKKIDDLDLDNDVLNCGSCFNPCPSINNTVPSCMGGNCVQGAACASGFYDTNNDLSDGCEGSCLVNCLIPNADITCIPACAGTCKPGYVDLDGDLAMGPSGNGCEFQCSTTNGGVEICDGLDNNCDGNIDENVNPLTDQQNCGGCGVVCSQLIPNAQTACNNGVCAFTGTCLTGYADNDGQDANGCEYQCPVQPAVPETCNGQDDNCNGIIDDAPTEIGQPCGTSNVGACKLGTYVACVATNLVCSGQIDPAAEVCDAPRGTAANALAPYDNDCDGASETGCAYVKGGPIQLDVNTSATTSASSTGSAPTQQYSAASFNNEMLVMYADPRTGDSDVFLQASLDGGATWLASDRKIVGPGNSNFDVEPYVFLRDGRGYLTWSKFDRDGSGNRHVRRVYVARANTPYDVADWTVAQPGVNANIDANSDSSVDTNIDCYNPQGVVVTRDPVATGTKDVVAVVWSEISGTAIAPKRNIFLRYSTDGGVSWLPNGATLAAKRIQVNASGAGFGEQPVIATDSAGFVYVAWRDRRLISGTSRQMVRFARVDLTDPINAPPTTVMNEVTLQPNADATANAEQIVLAASGANVNVGWVDLRQNSGGVNIKTIRVATSTNHGASWKQIGGVNDGEIVDPDGQFANAASPALAARNNDVAVTWEDTRSGRSDIYVNVSSNGGTTWQATTARADQGDGLGSTFSYTPTIAFGAPGTSTVFVAWQDLRFAGTSILANISVDGGKTFIARPAGAGDEGLPARMDVYASDLGNGATSQTPTFITTTTGVPNGSVIWVDFRTTTGADGSKGDIYTRRMAP